MIDLNSDLGEGAGMEADIVPLISSANVCCGVHAGNTAIIRQTLELCAKHGVVVGAHPGYPDREHFGRRELSYSSQEVEELLTTQLQTISDLAKNFDRQVKYVKPHGGLYHQCNRDASLADALIVVASTFQLAVMGLPRSCLAQRCVGKVRFIAEGFADRCYRDDGSLVPRTEANAMIDDPMEAVEQVLHLINTQGIETVCVHGDNPHAIEFVKQIRTELQQRNISIRPFV
jgi:UPF0271 protein